MGHHINVIAIQMLLEVDIDLLVTLIRCTDIWLSMLVLHEIKTKAILPWEDIILKLRNLVNYRYMASNIHG